MPRGKPVKPLAPVQAAGSLSRRMIIALGSLQVEVRVAPSGPVLTRLSMEQWLNMVDAAEKAGLFKDDKEKTK